MSKKVLFAIPSSSFQNIIIVIMQYKFYFTSFQLPQGILKDRNSTKSGWNFQQSDEQPPVDKAQVGEAIYHD